MMSMKICFYEDEKYSQFYPLTHLRPVYAMRAGIVPLFRRAERFFDEPDIGLCARPDLAGTVSAEFRDYPVNIIKRIDNQPVLFLNGRVRDYGDLADRVVGARLITKICDAFGETVGVFFPVETVDSIPEVATIELYLEALEAEGEHMATADTTATLYDRCWELVDDIEKEIKADFGYLIDKLPESNTSGLPEGFHVVEPLKVFVGDNVAALPGSIIDASGGPVYIGDNTRIESQVAIYGPCYIGPNSVVVAGKVAASSIGHTCRVGGEVEETIFQSYVNKYHAGFIGHSYVGSWVNFGAMTTNSDLKNNYSNIRVTVNGESYDTGSIKVGSFVGDHTKFGIGTLLTTGINVGVCCNLFGGGLITDKEVAPFSWGNSAGYQTYQFDKAIKAIRRTTERRNVELSSSEERLLQALAENQSDLTAPPCF
jgi:UDP-N-acetylglucosamine diphosphorylase/glucosamine-1-phosphate N-acetyltransferase